MKQIKYILMFFIAINVHAEDISSSDEYRQDAHDNLRLSINPFSIESLQLYELRRKAERQEIEQTVNQSQFNSAEFDTILSEINGQIFQQGADIINLKEEINSLRQNQPVQTTEQSVTFPTVNDTTSNETNSVAYPRENPEAIFYGMIDFGNGPELIYYDGPHLRTSAVNEYAPKPTLLEDGLVNGRVTYVSQNRARVDTNNVQFARTVPYNF